MNRMTQVVVLFVAIVAVFSFSQAGQRCEIVVCDTVSKVTVSENIMIDALKSLQEFSSNSFGWLSTIVGIVVVVFLNVMSMRDVDKKVRRMIKDQKKEFIQKQNEYEQYIQKEIKISLKEHDEEYQKKLKIHWDRIGDHEERIDILKSEVKNIKSEKN
jgi:hypothetical protein